MFSKVDRKPTVAASGHSVQGCIRWLQDIQATVRVQTTYVLDGLILVAYYPRNAVFVKRTGYLPKISKVSI